MDSVKVGASREIAVGAEQIHDLLSDLTRHWPLLGADLIEAGLVDGSGNQSARLILRGPLPGVERQVTTRVTHDEPPERFGGIAEAGRTHALIDWRLHQNGDGFTRVSFGAEIFPGGRRDRLLVAFARPWLQLRCKQVLERLEAELAV